MKNRLVQALSIGLSAMTLAGPVGMTVYAQSADAINDAETTKEELYIVTGDEEFVEDNMTDSVVVSIEMPQEEAIPDEVILDDVEIPEEIPAVEIMKDDSCPISEQVSALLDEHIEEAEAADIIKGTEKCVEEAQNAFDTAETKYNEALEAYNKAVEALEEYNSCLDEAVSNLNEAEAVLPAVQAHLEELQEQIDSTEKELTDAGIDILIAAEENREAIGEAYGAKVIQYFYIPYTEKLSEGQHIKNFEPIIAESDVTHVKVRYDVVDANGTVRSVISDFGLSFITADGQIELYVKKLVYDYSAPAEPTRLKSFKLKASPKGKSSNALTFVPSLQGNSNTAVVPNIIEDYISVGSESWEQMIKDYYAYLAAAKARLEAYEKLRDSYKNAEDDYNAAQEKVDSIRAQIEALEESKGAISSGAVANLEAQLKSAEADCSDAQSKLQRATDTLKYARAVYEERFSNKAEPENDGASYIDIEDEAIALSPVEEKADAGNPVIESSDNVSSDKVSSNKESYNKEAREETAAEKVEASETVEEPEDEADSSVVAFAGEDKHSGKGSSGGSGQTNPIEDLMIPENNDMPDPVEIVSIGEEETPLAITLAGILQHGKWFAGLAGVTAAGAGVSIFEVKRRAAAKIIDKLNQ